MQTITVKRTIKAPIEKVFDLLADHANYKLFPGVIDSKLLQEGSPDRNGVGAVREVVVKAGWFREKITAFDRPRRFDYLITETSLPLQHQGGSVQLEQTSAGTLVTWSSTLRVKTPLIGGLLTKLFVPRLGAVFGSMLKDTERRLAA
jgi:uncharacterized protein YndB with AHSA1/START domain